MRIATFICLIMVMVAIQTEVSCTQDQFSTCKEFFRKPIAEQDALFSTFPLTKQLEIFRCGMNRSPPEIGLAHEIAKGGEQIIPDLTAALRNEKDEWMQSALIEILRVMSIKGYLDGKQSTVNEIKEIVSRMKVSKIKNEATESLKQIEANSTKNGTLPSSKTSGIAPKYN